MRVILAIDPATTSGWAILAGAHLETSGKARTPEQVMSVAKLARQIADEHGAELHVVAETWSEGGWSKWGDKRGGAVRTLKGLAAAWGRWEMALAMVGVDSVIKVLPQTWRAAVLGIAPNTPGKVAKKCAVNYVRARFNVDAGTDEAEAICIGTWSVFGAPARESRKKR